MKCPDCNGKGTYKKSCSSGHCPCDFHIHNCRRCDGTGVIKK